MPEPTQPVQVLGYANSLVPGSEDGWHRDEGGLTLTVPPRPARRLLLILGAGLLAATVFAAACVSIAIALIDDQRSRDGGGLVFFIVAAASTCLWVRTLRRFVWRVRNLRACSFVRVSRNVMEISAPEMPGWGYYAVPRDRVLDLRGSIAGAAPGLLAYLQLRVVERDGTVCDVNIPWPPGASISEVTIRLRNELGLPIDPRGGVD